MKEAIILAGGLGTRLQSVVNDRPKCMALIADKPFLKYLFDYLERNKFDHIILSLGYKYNIVQEWLSTLDYSFKVSYTIEQEPLGTGGAIKYASSRSEADSFFVFNGDTFFDINTDKMMEFHNRYKSDITLALKPMSSFDRYGCVVLDTNHRIEGFKEKQYTKTGLINGGVYIINKKVLFNNTADKFSFEKDVLETQLKSLNIKGYIVDSYFIDIGIPTDYEKANIDFQNV